MGCWGFLSGIFSVRSRSTPELSVLAAQLSSGRQAGSWQIGRQSQACPEQSSLRRPIGHPPRPQGRWNLISGGSRFWCCQQHWKISMPDSTTRRATWLIFQICAPGRIEYPRCTRIIAARQRGCAGSLAERSRQRDNEIAEEHLATLIGPNEPLLRDPAMSYEQNRFIVPALFICHAVTRINGSDQTLTEDFDAHRYPQASEGLDHLLRRDELSVSSAGSGDYQIKRVGHGVQVVARCIASVSSDTTLPGVLRPLDESPGSCEYRRTPMKCSCLCSPGEISS